ncbi:Protein of unknown function DUF2612 [uncultured Caudovirales phage]|uniref:Uncharacterized protein n=1 Tax=uncultured Caudovirales phage TaxID=2100421 RepID=A0A6J5RUH4_9CAUD|nr:Protein of unknown function DUF2612 [uncultured Caudovirales phage]
MSLVSEALERATSQFQASPKVLALLESIVGPLDDVKTTTDEFKTERWIDTAIGSHLDGCGYIVGELRAGRDDESYRAAIRFRVFINVSEGTPSALIQGLQYLIDSDDKQYLEMYPATAILFADGPNVPVDIHTQMQDLAPAAISDVPVLVSYTELPFRFSKELPLGELFVNGKTSYLTANGSDIKVNNTSIVSTGPTFGGIAPAELTAGEQLIDVNGSILVINSVNHQTIIESGYHLTGVF